MTHQLQQKKQKRRTLKDIEYYPSPKEILERIENSPGYPYKENRDFYRIRDKCLVALQYLIAARISELLRLVRSQFKFPKEGIKYRNRIVVQGIKLSKSHRKDKPRREQYRQEAWLPLKGPRAPLTQYVVDYLKTLQPDQRLFMFDRKHAWRIIRCITGEPDHWLRAYGEEYLYEEWDHDLLAVADYVKVDPRTLQEYIRRRYGKYKVV